MAVDWVTICEWASIPVDAPVADAEVANLARHTGHYHLTNTQVIAARRSFLRKVRAAKSTNVLRVKL